MLVKLQLCLERLQRLSLLVLHFLTECADSKVLALLDGDSEPRSMTSSVQQVPPPYRLILSIDSPGHGYNPLAVEKLMKK